MEPLTRKTLLETFHSYGTPRPRWRIGGEFERALVRGDGQPVFYDETHGVRWVLEQMIARDDWAGEYEGEHLIALKKRNASGTASITLEPGGQVELSGAPHASLSDLKAEIECNRKALLGLTDGLDRVWIAAGYTPVANIDDIRFVPKGRYDVMKKYLPVQGDLALSMMKGTCSCLLYTSPSPRDKRQSRMPSSA